MRFSDHIFRAYDLRGVFGKDFDSAFAYKLGRAFVTHLKCTNVVIGRDARKSSPEIFKELVRGVLDQGANAIELGECTTPMLYFAVASHKYESGIMITASHNPAEYNGFKFTKEQGIPIGLDSGGREIRGLVKNGKFTKPSKRGKHSLLNIFHEYVEHCLLTISKIAEFKVVADFGNGMSSMLVPTVFEALPCELIPMFSEIDMSFPNHVANPAKPENLQAIKARVVKEGADLGMAFDGDGDRVFFITEKGETVPGDFTLALIAEDLLEESPGGKIVYDLRSSWAVRDTIKRKGGVPIETRVGYAFIKKLMAEKKSIFAGELSGHFYFKSNFYHESSVIAALKIMELMCKKHKKLSELVNPLRKYFQSGEINRQVANRKAALAAVEQAFAGYSISKLDGIKIETKDYWFNLRPSNTEPVVRFTAEAKTKELLKEITDKVLAIIS